MKFGLRTPSLKKRFSARTSVKRMVRAKLRVPRGMGMITNPKRALYNKVYNKTSFSIDRVGHRSIRSSRNANTSLGFKAIGYFILFCICIAVWPIGVLVAIYYIYKFFLKKKAISPEQPEITISARVNPGEGLPQNSNEVDLPQNGNN